MAAQFAEPAAGRCERFGPFGGDELVDTGLREFHEQLAGSPMGSARGLPA